MSQWVSYQLVCSWTQRWEKHGDATCVRRVDDGLCEATPRHATSSQAGASGKRNQRIQRLTTHVKHESRSDARPPTISHRLQRWRSQSMTVFHIPNHAPHGVNVQPWHHPLLLPSSSPPSDPSSSPARYQHSHLLILNLEHRDNHTAIPPFPSQQRCIFWAPNVLSLHKKRTSSAKWHVNAILHNSSFCAYPCKCGLHAGCGKEQRTWCKREEPEQERVYAHNLTN